jgi:uncharacterized protein DUF6275
MADNLKGIPFSSDDEGRDIPRLAREIVYDQAVSYGVQKENPDFSIDDVYVVWFAYVLGCWKGLCSTSLPDGRYYEVTYNAVKKIGFVDTYRKTHNVEFYLNDED